MSSSSLHTLRSGALTLLASVLATGVGAAQVEAEVARLLAVELEAVEQTAELAESLVGLGTGAIGPVFEALAAGAVTGAEGERIELGPLHGEAGLAAFASFSPTAVRSFLGSLDRAALDASGRRTALAVYGRMGTQDDLRHIASIAAPLVRSELIALPTRDAFRSAIEQILSRDAAALGRVGDAFEVAHPTLKGELIGALRSVRARGTIGTLNRLLGREPELDLLILAALRDGSPDRAERAMVRHVEGARDAILHRLEALDRGLGGP